jgi:hypothetical protein
VKASSSQIELQTWYCGGVCSAGRFSPQSVCSPCSPAPGLAPLTLRLLSLNASPSMSRMQASTRGCVTATSNSPSWLHVLKTLLSRRADSPSEPTEKGSPASSAAICAWMRRFASSHCAGVSTGSRRR